MRAIAFCVAASVIALAGLATIFKEAGWPSEAERKSTLLRSIRGGIGGTMLGVGLMLLIAYGTSPSTFFNGWSLRSMTSSFCLIVVPVFFLLTVGAYIQFSVWEHNRPKWTQRLREITKPKQDEEED